jgi:hypothetical protein
VKTTEFTYNVDLRTYNMAAMGTLYRFSVVDMDDVPQDLWHLYTTGLDKSLSHFLVFVHMYGIACAGTIRKNILNKMDDWELYTDYLIGPGHGFSNLGITDVTAILLALRSLYNGDSFAVAQAEMEKTYRVRKEYGY